MPPWMWQTGELRSARIESLRAFAAISVLAWHALFLADRFPGSGLVAHLAYGGQYGVYLFFALTGFLLFLPFARRSFADGRPIELRRYAINRIVRILPLYYFVLAVLLVVSHGGGSLEQWLRFGTLTQSFFADTVINDVDGPMWSLAVELQFYALLPLLALVLGVASRKSMKNAALLIAGLGLASFAVWLVKVYDHHPVDFRWAYSLPVTFFQFVPGMLVALAVVRLEQRPAKSLPPAVLLLGAGVGCWVFASYRPAIAVPVSAVASLCLLAGVVLPLRGRSDRLLRVLDVRALALIGTVSYSLYLWHYPVVQSLGRHMDVGFYGLVGAGLLVCLPIAGLSYLVVERPFLRLRRRWGSTPASVSSTGGAARSRSRAPASPRATSTPDASRPSS